LKSSLNPASEHASSGHGYWPLIFDMLLLVEN